MEEKSGTKLRLCAVFLASGCIAAAKSILCTWAICRKRGLSGSPAVRPKPSTFNIGTESLVSRLETAFAEHIWEILLAAARNNRACYSSVRNCSISRCKTQCVTTWKSMAISTQITI